MAWVWDGPRPREAYWQAFRELVVLLVVQWLHEEGEARAPQSTVGEGGSLPPLLQRTGSPGGQHLHIAKGAGCPPGQGVLGLGHPRVPQPCCEPWSL